MSAGMGVNCAATGFDDPSATSLERDPVGGRGISVSADPDGREWAVERRIAAWGEISGEGPGIVRLG